MARQPVITLGSPQPITPPRRQRRGGQLQDLLAQFGSQSSVESATKKRRLLSQQKDEQMSPIPDCDTGRKRSLRRQTAGHHAALDSNTEDEPLHSSKKDTRPESIPAGPSPEDSEDELAPSARPGKTSNRIAAYKEELKMEKRKRERANTEGLRRSTRGRRSIILESDTMPTPSLRQQKAAPSPKLNTIRNRLRDDIAKGAKARANNFLVANKDFFLPLLPKNNKVAKLVAEGKAQPIIEYEEIKEQPKGVTAVMKPYQLSGLSFLVHLYNNGFSGILGDEMGLGKTLQTLSLFQYLEELDQQKGVVSEEPRPYLIICPLSVLNSWVTEAERWVPELGVMRFHGAMSERTRLKRVAAGLEDMKGNETSRARHRKQLRKAGQKLSNMPARAPSDSFKIVVTTYETFQAEQAWFKHSFAWRYVVLDEGHKIKNSSAQISTALKSVSAEYRLILTGTPLQNNMLEMWSLLTWLYPNVFDARTETLFRESFDLSKGKANKQTMTDARRLLELIMLRRMKDSPSVNLGLPPKEEVLLYVPLTPMQRFWYTRLLTRIDDGVLNEVFAGGKEKEKVSIEHEMKETQLLHKLEEMDQAISAGNIGDEWAETAKILQEAVAKEETDTSASKGAWKKLMNLVMQLRKCCSHPYLLPGVGPDPYYLGDHVIRASGKFILLEKLLKHTVLDQGKKVLIFSSFTSTLDCCEDLLSLVSNHGERFKYLRLDGSTARARRNLDIRLFNQADSDYNVMLVSTRAGGLGINLTSAQDVIFLDEDWNPQITLQAEARAHRIGQTKKVTIYKLCTQGTVEEQMMGRIRKKLYLSAKITESMQNIHGNQSTGNKKASIDEDMPQMNTSQLMTLVRRGAQTLSHPEIDVKEMVSWDLDTMMKRCRDQSADLTDVAANTEVDEDKWLSTMERIECAVFEGKRHQRNTDDSYAGTSSRNILPETVTRDDRRKNKNTTVMVNGFAISKESMGCGEWEAVPTLAGKDPRLAEPVREKRREFDHEDHCLECFEEAGDGKMVECKGCPRAYHFDCLDPHYQAKAKNAFGNFHCSQHNCWDCGKSTTDAGGLMFRCRWCPQGFCEDCLDWDKTELIGENLPEFEVLDEEAMPTGFYIKCPSCIKLAEKDKDHKAWIEEMEKMYYDERVAWLQEREKKQHELNERHASVKLEDDDEADSLPALTDTSRSTRSIGGSGVATPKDPEQPTLGNSIKSNKRSFVFGEINEAKKAKITR
ncbi:SWI/SNF-related matrix-associated actin-dependent regulator of chromatin subfamily A member 5 [Curvularia clavata]|uniref:SWI/SNF-related matrix-associated actin-dependent regulator of chromatin subfamily A member 5 n=1 Tax=Curvularia clavata TaxID=95742 RepID=A0A9Q9DUZ8_CURCL|nr:SWI/SNF-related matrix-associated actin-dependent regulator of chromatin subfamily A member 5 [Curvularia clavata]